MNRITDFHYGTHHYVICWSVKYKRFFGIDKDWIKDGKLIHSVNGFNGNCGETLADCIMQCQITAMIADCMKEGLSIESAYRKVWEQLGYRVND